MRKQKIFGNNVKQASYDNGFDLVDSTIIVDGKVFVDGIELPAPPTKCWNTTVVNNKVFIDGYEFKNGKWKKTLRAWWHLWF